VHFKCVPKIILTVYRSGILGVRDRQIFEPWHYARTIGLSPEQLDIEYLQVLVKYGGVTSKSECTYIGAANSKRKLCRK
jgi:hypothetical protein